MNIKMFNEWQTKWVLKLIAFDFVIKHQSKKSNSVNAPFQHFDYQDINGEMQNLLSTLQQKLSRIELMNICTSKMRLACAAISQFFNFDQIERNTSSNSLKQKKNGDLIQRVFHVIIAVLIQKKAFFEKNFFLIIEMIKTLQLKNKFITIHKFKIETS